MTRGEKTSRRARLTLGMGTIVSAVMLFALIGAAWGNPPVSGAIFTTDSACTGVNLNIYGDKDDVYLNGGPAHPGAAGLPAGEYYVQVTEPDGTLLGTSNGAADETPVVVDANGDFVGCYQLSAILLKAFDSSAGYDTTSNNGGVYKVWVSNQSDFENSSTKTDNFKVKAGDGGPPPTADLDVVKFYDANVNGVNDDGPEIAGWKVGIEDAVSSLIRYTPVSIVLDPGNYTVSEFTPVEANWMHTTPTSVNVSLAAGDSELVEFGNVCLGQGGGLTIGFWSNKSGQALYNNAEMVALNLRNNLNGKKPINGDHFNPTGYSQFRTWLLGANSTNMAYMLSAQLAGMKLNVLSGNVDGAAIIHAPGVNASGFISINDLMAAANAELGLHGLVLEGSDFRAYQTALKNALDNANNNVNFVQANPCAFSFAP